MSFLTAIWSSIIAINFTFFALFIFIWLRERESKEYFLISTAALGASGVAFFELFGFNTTNISEVVTQLSYIHIPLFILLVSLTWYIYYYFKTANLRLAQVFTGLWILTLIVNFISKYSITYNEISEIHTVSLPWGDKFSQIIGTANEFKIIPDFATLIFIIYIFLATFKLYKSGSRKKAIIVGGSIIFFILLAGIHSPLLDAGLIVSPSIISFSFLAIIFAMVFELTDKILESSILSKEIVAKDIRWLSLLEKMSFVVLEFNRDGKIIYSNPFYLKITGFKNGEIIGKHYLELLTDDEKDGIIELKKSLNKSVELPTIKSKLITKNGSEVIMNWLNVKIFDINDVWTSTLSVGFDITQQQKSFEEIKELKDQLEEENIELKKEIFLEHDYKEILGNSDVIKYALARVEQVAPTDSTVLIEGETGVGKELFAKAIHHTSSRKEKPLVKVNCAVIPKNLIESELFGHEKGAFTGADKLRRGRFEVADGATIFLDEIGELPLEIQSKLLRIIDEGEFERLGSNKTIKVDARIIAATNRILKDEIKKGTFREDLYYRLSVYPISIPPLRKRKEDIQPIVKYFVERFSRKLGKKINTIPKSVVEMFKDYSWPGNVRELRNIIERAVIITDEDTLSVVDRLDPSEQIETEPNFKSLDNLEREYIIEVLEHFNWKISGANSAGEILKLHPNTLRSRMSKLGIIKK